MRTRAQEFNLAADMLERAADHLRAQADGADLDARVPANAARVWFMFAEVGQELDQSEMLLSATGFPMLADAVNRIGEALEAISRAAGDDAPARDGSE